MRTPPAQFIRNALYSSLGSYEIFYNKAQWIITIPFPKYMVPWTTEIRLYSKEEHIYIVGTLDGTAPPDALDTLPKAPAAAEVPELR